MIKRVGPPLALCALGGAPLPTLDPAERTRYTEAARKAHMQRLALASSKACGAGKAASEATPA
jgi:hypothetical protein